MNWNELWFIDFRMSIFNILHYANLHFYEHAFILCHYQNKQTNHMEFIVLQLLKEHEKISPFLGWMFFIKYIEVHLLILKIYTSYVYDASFTNYHALLSSKCAERSADTSASCLIKPVNVLIKWKIVKLHLSDILLTGKLDIGRDFKNCFMVLAECLKNLYR